MLRFLCFEQGSSSKSDEKIWLLDNHNYPIKYDRRTALQVETLPLTTHPVRSSLWGLA